VGSLNPPSRISCWNYRVKKILKIVDGDTLDCEFDLGFGIAKTERVRVAGVDTPEKRTRNLEEKALGIDATNWLTSQLETAIAGDVDLFIRTQLDGGMGKYGRLLGWLYVGDEGVSLNEQMITEGYAWSYDGGKKEKDFEELRVIRRNKGTLIDSVDSCPSSVDPA
jgi:micrococcal nuclease